MTGCSSARGACGATRWRVVRDLRLLTVFAVVRGVYGWRDGLPNTYTFMPPDVANGKARQVRYDGLG